MARDSRIMVLRQGSIGHIMKIIQHSLKIFLSTGHLIGKESTVKLG